MLSGSHSLTHTIFHTLNSLANSIMSFKKYSHYPWSNRGISAKRVKLDSAKSNIHVFYSLLLDPHARGNLGESTLLHVYPYNFLIVLITCAWLLLRLLTAYGFRLSTQVQIFFLLIEKGTLKALRPCRRWSDDLYAEDPTLEYLYPLPFFSPPLSCSFSVFCHFSCQPAKLRSLKAIKRVF